MSPSAETIAFGANLLIMPTDVYCNLDSSFCDDSILFTFPPLLHPDDVEI